MVHFYHVFALAFFIKALLWKDVISNRVFQTYLLLGVIYAALIEVIQYNWILCVVAIGLIGYLIWQEWEFHCGFLNIGPTRSNVFLDKKRGWSFEPASFP
jgi:hypothetical protein